MKRPLVTFSCDQVADVNVLLDQTPVQITGGYGGWQTVARARRKGLTQFDGRDPFTMTVPVLFDGFSSGDGQEIPISRLSRMALPPSDGGEPPTVKIGGDGVPRPGPTQWVISGLAWGSNVIWDSVGGVRVRVRQDCVVTLTEYVAPDREALKSLPGLNVVSGKTKVPTRVTVKAGQTLRQIALAVYGDAKKWQKIATANNIRDPKSIKAGQVLRIP